MKNRTILYGYRCSNGVIDIEPHEQNVVLNIYKSYIEGDSLKKIAKHLNDGSVEYMPGVCGWNKARLKRITEDRRYLGCREYPAIINSETYSALQKIKEQRNTQKDTDRTSVIYQINAPVRCPICGSEMYRRRDSRIKYCAERWTCKNDECRHVIGKSDEDMLNDITELMNIVITSPEMIESPEYTNEEISREIMRTDNDIRRMFDSAAIQKDNLRKLLLRRVSLKYRDIVAEEYMTKKLKAVLTGIAPLKTFSIELFSEIVKEISFNKDGTVDITLINGQRIGKEQIDGNRSVEQK